MGSRADSLGSLVVYHVGGESEITEYELTCHCFVLTQCNVIKNMLLRKENTDNAIIKMLS